jgi:hypothetical protein
MSFAVKGKYNVTSIHFLDDPVAGEKMKAIVIDRFSKMELSLQNLSLRQKITAVTDPIDSSLKNDGRTKTVVVDVVDELGNKEFWFMPFRMTSFRDTPSIYVEYMFFSKDDPFATLEFTRIGAAYASRELGVKYAVFDLIKRDQQNLYLRFLKRLGIDDLKVGGKDVGCVDMTKWIPLLSCY